MSSQTFNQENQQAKQIIEDDYSNMPALEPPYKIPMKPYYLATTFRPLEEICAVTYNLNSISEEFKTNLLFRICNRPWPTTFGMFDAPSYTDALKMIIGEDGYFLKLTTLTCDVDMIWNDRQNNKFLFWGPSIYAVVQAMNQIRSRIIKYTVYINPAQQIQAQQIQAKQIQAQQNQAQQNQAKQIQAQQIQDGIEDISDDEECEQYYDQADEDEENDREEFSSARTIIR